MIFVMRLVQIDTGFKNLPAIDLDRIVYFQWFGGDSGTGFPRLEILFFGCDTPYALNFDNVELAEKSYKFLCQILNQKDIS